MVRSAVICAVLCVQSAWAAVPLSSVKKTSNLPIVADKFIVEFEDAADIPTKRSLTHESFYTSLRNRAVGFEVTKEFNVEGLFVGALLTLSDQNDVAEVTQTPGIKAIRPVVKFQRPKPVSIHVVSGVDDAALPPDTQSTHVLTGVDKLRAEGITGFGIKVGILDTGIDYTHPALGAGFGPGHKVIGGFDLVGDDYDGSNTPVPDPDPLDQCGGHGTHVAGIIAADSNNPFNISGVAPSALLSAYRIFGCVGFVTDDVIVDGLLLGVQDGQDILTLSLGGADGWTESSSSVVASRIAESGKIVTIAAGNDGASGAWYTSSPGNGINVISVASLDNTAIPLQTATVQGASHAPIPYFELFPFPFPDPLPIFAISNSTTVVDDACNPLPPSVPDLSPFLVIIRRGTCTFVQKLTNVAAKGARIAFIYDNGNGFNAIDVGNFNASLIQAADGEFLVSQFVAGTPITVSFPQSGGVIDFPLPSGGLISSFTSYGPSNDFFFKPAIAAPGGSILSTIPVPQGSYAVESGTSMATPFLAGAAALLLEVKGKSKAVTSSARTLFQTTSRTVPSSHTDGDPLQTVAQQGAGLINVFDAIHATTIISPAELILNDTAHFNGVQSFSVQNKGSSAKAYTLSHTPAGTALTIIEGTIFPELGPVPLTADSATVSFTPARFTVPAGGRQTVVVRITAPSGLDPSRLPVYSGFIHVKSGSEDLHVTYIGLAAALKDAQVLDDTDFFFGVPIPLILDSTGNPQEEPTDYTFVGDDFPTILWRQTFGTPVFRADLVDENIEFVPTIETRDPEGHNSFTFPQRGSGTFARVAILGPLFEIDWLTRNDEFDNGFNTVGLNAPTFANGSVIPDGSYRILARSLRVTGDPTVESDYDSWLSPVVGVTTGL